MSDVTGFPSGVAVTPDGRWLINLGFTLRTVTVYDARTLEPVAGPLEAIDSILLAQPHAVVVSPDGSMAVLTNRSGVIGVCLPSLELLFHLSTAVLNSPRHVVPDAKGENYYISSQLEGIARISATGEVQAFFEDAFVTAAMSLTRDGQELLVVTDNGRRLVVLSTPDLNPRLSVDFELSVDVPFKGEVVVPLRDKRAIIIGGHPVGAETAVGEPIMALPVDLVTGAVGSPQVLFEVEGPPGPLLLGDGNEWVDVGEATAIVPTMAGTVTIDTNLGTVAFHSAAELEENVPPCCDIARYPEGERVVFSALDSSTRTGGFLIVYDVDETVDETP
ncbi:MAG: hypothetical protein ACREMK_13060 [Gemmatimonadota bacterium]